MRIGAFVVLLAILGGVSAARADVIFSGSVSTSTTGGSSCSGSGAASSSLSLSCTSSDPTTTATLMGTGDAFSGTLAFHGSVDAEYGPMGQATGSGRVDLSETYVLLGGVGTATVNFTVTNPTDYGDDSSSIECNFVFDGTSQPCTDLYVDGGQTFSEQVVYGVPFSVDFDAQLEGLAFDGQPSDGVIIYGFGPTGLVVVPTPEPSSVWLLIPGMCGALLAARRRFRGL